LKDPLSKIVSDQSGRLERDGGHAADQAVYRRPHVCLAFSVTCVLQFEVIVFIVVIACSDGRQNGLARWTPG
jgi:hypothetical protein